MFVATLNLAQHQACDRSGQDADQRRAVHQLQAKARHHVALMFVQALDRTGHDTDGREVGEGHQEHRQDPQAARRQFGRHFLQLHHCHELVGNQLGGHDAANLQGFVLRNAHDPGERIEEVAEDFLEAQAEDGAEHTVERGDQGDEADQHRGNDNRYFEAGQDIFTQHFEEALAFVQVAEVQLFFFIGVVRVDQRQHDKGAEHVQYQRRHHELGVQHGHVGADDGHGHRRHRGRRHGVHALFRHLAQDILVGDEVFGLAEDQRTDGVE